jgi:hypothetical protein
MERDDMHAFPATAVWRAAAQRLREAARDQDDAVEQRTLLTLAADCEMLAAEAQQQPGKPKPPGNPPEPPDAEQPAPVEEPPQPVPPPRPEPPPPPLQTRK